jgi:hypothetical protein
MYFLIHWGFNGCREQQRVHELRFFVGMSVSSQWITICDAVWLDARVPAGYWDLRENRTTYLHWLGQQLGFQAYEDWYQLVAADFSKHRGLGVFKYWNSSPVMALRDVFPDYDWKEWLSRSTSQRFWQKISNQRRYIDWLGRQLGFADWKDWYQVTNVDFQENHGASLLHFYDHTVSQVVMRLMPERDWQEWLFHRIPDHFWRQKRNCRRYLNWLGRRLGFQKWSDWYAVRKKDFLRHHGKTFLEGYGMNPCRALQEHVPEYDWKEWLFAKVPSGFWGDRRNRKRYLDWLGKQLGFVDAQQWRLVRRRDLIDHRGGGLMTLRANWRQGLIENEYLDGAASVESTRPQFVAESCFD